MRSKAKSPSSSKKKTRHIGIYSGTFDPVHIGHLGFALQSMEVAGLNEVVFVPEASPRNKTDVTALKHRLALLERAVASYDELSVVSLGVSQFTATSVLPELRAMFGDAELWLLLGSDVAMGLAHWQDLDQLLGNMSLVVGVRSGDSRGDVLRSLQAAGAFGKTKHLLVDSLLPMENSTRIRSADIGKHSALLPVVAEYARSNALYYFASSRDQQ